MKPVEHFLIAELLKNKAMRELTEEYGNRLAEIPQAVIIERGLGEEDNGVVIPLHEDYSGYTELARGLPWGEFYLLLDSFA